LPKAKGVGAEGGIADLAAAGELGFLAGVGAEVGAAPEPAGAELIRGGACGGAEGDGLAAAAAGAEAEFPFGPDDLDGARVAGGEARAEAAADAAGFERDGEEVRGADGFANLAKFVERGRVERGVLALARLRDGAGVFDDDEAIFALEFVPNRAVGALDDAMHPALDHAVVFEGLREAARGPLLGCEEEREAEAARGQRDDGGEACDIWVALDVGAEGVEGNPVVNSAFYPKQRCSVAAAR